MNNLQIMKLNLQNVKGDNYLKNHKFKEHLFINKK